MFVLLYRSFNTSTAMEGLAWAHEMSTVYGAMAVNIQCTPIEQKLFLKVLKGNMHLVPKDYKVDRHETEKDYKVSVLLPVGPLEYGPLAKLNSNVGCVVCGKRTVSRCSQCQSASYCGSSECFFPLSLRPQSHGQNVEVELVLIPRGASRAPVPLSL